MQPAEQRDHVTDVVAANLRALKAIRRVTDKEIGAALGLSGSAVNERMRGMTACTAPDLVAFADYFGVSVQALFASDPPIILDMSNITPVIPYVGQRQLFDPDTPIVPRSLLLVN